jgi:hypothetical protein
LIHPAQAAWRQYLTVFTEVCSITGASSAAAASTMAFAEL